MKILRQRRYDQLKGKGLLPFEARQISRHAKRHWRMQYLKKLFADRRRDAAASPSYRAFVNSIKFKYQEMKWTRAGVADPWAMFRWYREQYLEEGDSPRPRRKKRYDEHGRRIDKGKVAEQKLRFRERERERKQRAPQGFNMRLTQEDKERQANERGY